MSCVGMLESDDAAASSDMKDLPLMYMYRCNLCGHGSSTEDLAKQHVLCHDTSETDNKATFEIVQIENVAGSEALPLVGHPLVCFLCGKRYESQQRLQKHINIVHDARNRTRTCDICQKTFNRPSSLIEHMRMHSDLRPFQCVSCGASYKHKKHLNHHLRISTRCRFFEGDTTL